jgi:hypothetical protein
MAVGNLGLSYEELINKKKCVSTWERNEGSGLQGYDATSSSVVAYFTSNELEELCTQQQRHILKCTSVKTSEFARIKIYMGQHA